MEDPEEVQTKQGDRHRGASQRRREETKLLGGMPASGGGHRGEKRKGGDVSRKSVAEKWRLRNQ